MSGMEMAERNSGGETPRRRRVRYRGTHPRSFEERYKERDAEAYPEMQGHIREQGRTPAGTHVPVMLAEVMRWLAPRAGEAVADVTLGYGGHAEAFLGAIGATGRLVGLDVDADALERAGVRLAKPGGAVSLHRSNFAGIGKALRAEGLDGFDVIFADLGVSSMQIDDPKRGFSYKHEGPLDMRMDSRLARTAADVLAAISEKELAKALADLADEEDAAAVAAEIVRRQEERAITRTLELAEAVLAGKRLTPQEWRKIKAKEPEAMHPAARTFQALRILVNDELGALAQLLRAAPWCMRAGGRIGIVTFHSGEDRIVKKAFEEGLEGGTYEEISSEAIRPTGAEVAANPRARAGKFRWARARSIG
jgi:16S rRNA (cytosine1402-N4)-methyltransferase